MSGNFKEEHPHAGIEIDRRSLTDKQRARAVRDILVDFTNALIVDCVSFPPQIRVTRYKNSRNGGKRVISYNIWDGKFIEVRTPAASVDGEGQRARILGDEAYLKYGMRTLTKIMALAEKLDSSPGGNGSKKPGQRSSAKS